MWLGEQINSHGLGNGSSMVIFAGIVAGLPAALIKLISDVQLGQTDPLLIIVLLALIVGVIAGVVFLEKGERRIPVHYARKVVGNRVYGGQTSFIPLKLNSASVIPVIFSGSIMSMLLFLVNWGVMRKIAVFEFLGESLAWNAPLNWVLTALLIIFFAYIYTAIIFNPVELAENIRKGGGFIPGLRPGRKTAEFFEYILLRVCLPGAIYLASLAIVPRMLATTGLFPLMFEGTSMLIVVGVALDASAQIESFLIERRYEGFLSTGRLKNRLGR
jgi:preprotein translocase subunit SecY